jgi:lipopolysaccharide transport system ATP-binding protein
MKKVLEVEGVSKSFKDYSSELKRILSWFGLGFQPIQEHKILNNISFSLFAGEAVGVVGRNGAGKSTLLKIITGTLKPSNGSINVDGRISAILELGMGFHPDLTGRQNVYHSAGLMGYTVAQIDAVISDIEDFAEVGEYFDQPVRTYSSGMQMRVAFAVVTAYRPEILIVDEALSVGDAYFQHKSFARIKAFREQGTALLLVSHDHGAIQAICDRAILLEQGVILKDGDPEEVMDFYNALIADKGVSTIRQHTKENGKVETISGTGEAEILSAGLLNDRGEQVEVVSVGDVVTMRIRVKALSDIQGLVVGYLIKDRLGQPIFGTNTYHHQLSIGMVKAGEVYLADFVFSVCLGEGSYTVTVAAHAHDTHLSSNYQWKDQAMLFSVVNMSQAQFVGIAWLNPVVRVEHEK